MKRLLWVGALLGIGSLLWATTQYQNIGTVKMSTSTVQGGLGLWSLPRAQILGLTATAVGQLIFCQDCINAGTTLGVVCVSTGATTSGQFVISGSSLAVVTTCQ